MTAENESISEFNKKPTSSEILNQAIEDLDEAKYRFCLFVDGFKRHIERAIEEGHIKAQKHTEKRK